mgnify:CR=1 FL=1
MSDRILLALMQLFAIIAKIDEQDSKKSNAPISSTVGRKIIENYLFESAENRNEKTLQSLKNYGQQEIGIVTKDLIVIDKFQAYLSFRRN